MRLTTRGRYAVTALLDLALHACDGPVVLADISGRQGISLSYLEQLFARLRRAGLITSLRGPGGGYLPARPAGEIFVAEIVDAVDETLDATRCGGAGNCQHGRKCLTHHLWCDLSEQIHTFLSGISLAGLMERREVRQVSGLQDRLQQVADPGAETEMVKADIARESSAENKAEKIRMTGALSGFSQGR